MQYLEYFVSPPPPWGSMDNRFCHLLCESSDTVDNVIDRTCKRALHQNQGRNTWAQSYLG